MLMRVQKYRAPLQCFAVLSNAFTPEEVDKIIFLEKLMQFNAGQVGMAQSGPSGENLRVRNSDISWLTPDDNSSWVFERLSSIIPMVNYDHFLYNIEGIEAVQYTKYGEDQHYDWHMDAAFGWSDSVRKISMTLMLDNPDDYEGGDLQVCHAGNFNDIATLRPNKGDAVFFASWMPHRVTPVTKGTRRSLVSWILGDR